MAIGCGVPAPYGSNAARRTSAHRRGGVADRALDPEAVWGKFARDSLLEEPVSSEPVSEPRRRSRRPGNRAANARRGWGSYKNLGLTPCTAGFPLASRLSPSLLKSRNAAMLNIQIDNDIILRY